MALCIEDFFLMLKLVLISYEPEIQTFVASSKSKMSSIAYIRIKPIMLIGTKES